MPLPLSAALFLALLTVKAAADRADAVSRAHAGTLDGAASGVGFSWNTVKSYFEGDFYLVKELGEGTFGKTFLVEARSSAARKYGVERKKRYALKVLKLPKWARNQVGDVPLHVQYDDQSKDLADLREEARGECRVAQKFHEKGDTSALRGYLRYFPRCLHDGVPSGNSVKKRDLGVTPPDFLLMENAVAPPTEFEGVALEHLEHVSWEDFVKMQAATKDIAQVYYDIMKQSLEALSLLEKIGYSHHDLKLDNMVVGIWFHKQTQAWRPSVRLIDFGASLPTGDRNQAYQPSVSNPSKPPESQYDKDGEPLAFDPVFPWTWDLYMMGAATFLDLLVGDLWLVIVPYGLAAWHKQNPTKNKLSQTHYQYFKQDMTTMSKPDKQISTKDLVAVCRHGTSFLSLVKTTEGLESKGKVSVKDIKRLVKLSSEGYASPSGIYKGVWKKLLEDPKLSSFLDMALEVLGQMLAYRPKTRGSASELLKGQAMEKMKDLLEVIEVDQQLPDMVDQSFAYFDVSVIHEDVQDDQSILGNPQDEVHPVEDQQGKQREKVAVNLEREEEPLQADDTIENAKEMEAMLRQQKLTHFEDKGQVLKRRQDHKDMVNLAFMNGPMYGGRHGPQDSLKMIQEQKRQNVMVAGHKVDDEARQMQDKLEAIKADLARQEEEFAPKIDPGHYQSKLMAKLKHNLQQQQQQVVVWPPQKGDGLNFAQQQLQAKKEKARELEAKLAALHNGPHEKPQSDLKAAQQKQKHIDAVLKLREKFQVHNGPHNLFQPMGAADPKNQEYTKVLEAQQARMMNQHKY